MPLASFIGLQGAYFVKSGYIKQGKLHLSPFDKTFEDFTLVSAERDIFTVNIPIARLQFSDKDTLRSLAISQEVILAYIVG